MIQLNQCASQVAAVAGLFIITAIVATSAQADKAAIKVGDIDASQDTTIQIKKGALNTAEKIKYEIISGNDEVIGDPSKGKTAAYASWKTACADWKKEFREDNRENRVLSISCGNAQISNGEALGEYVYKSTASYKMRVRMEEPLNAPAK